MALAAMQPDDLLVLPRLEGRVPVNDERDRALVRSGAAPALAEVVRAMQEADFGQRLPRVLTGTKGPLGFCPSLLQLVDVDVAVDRPLGSVPQLLLEREYAFPQVSGFLGMLVVVASEKLTPKSQVVAIAWQGEAGMPPAVGARCPVVACARLSREPAELPNLALPSPTGRSARSRREHVAAGRCTGGASRGGEDGAPTRPVDRWLLSATAWGSYSRPARCSSAVK